MLQVHAAERVEDLALRLIELIEVPPPDAFTPEWIAVPTQGMARWLRLELARSLGRSRVDDGIAANIRTPFPGALRAALLDPDGTDPWTVRSLTWSVVAALTEPDSASLPAALREARPAAGRYGVARRIADLFDRYHLHRPDMILDWVAGEPRDGRGAELTAAHRWQFDLWRGLRADLGVPSPPERLPSLLDDVASGRLDLDLPERIAFFGLSTLPGGTSFVEIAAAVAKRRAVHLYVLESSPGLVARLEGAPPRAGDPRESRLRSDLDALVPARHRLLRSWGDRSREAALLLTTGASAAVLTLERTEAPASGAAAPDPAPSLLARLQAALRADEPPLAELVPDAADRSVQFHACPGPTRQVEVLRDLLLRLLADDPTLTEDDIAVLCPALDDMAPILAAAFGPSSDDPAPHPEHGTAPPRLRYRIADRSVRAENSVTAATLELLDLVSGRFEAPRVLDFIALPALRRRFALGDVDLSRITEWVTDANVRWGLDPDHRRAHGLDVVHEANSWQHGLDRILIGMAISPRPAGSVAGGLPPIDIEGDDVTLAGHLAEIIGRLRDLVVQASRPHPIGHWVELLSGAVDSLFTPPPEADWQISSVLQSLRQLEEEAELARSAPLPELELRDIRRLLGDRLQGAPGRPDFFRGGVTVTSLTPLRSIPFRVVCLLGLDQRSLDRGPLDGDDLIASSPRVGDPDPGGEQRQALLEAVLAACDHLIVLRTGRDLRTNRAVPAPIVLAELRDAVFEMIDPDHRDELAQRIEIDHPRQSFDEVCLRPGALVPLHPFSFDPASLAAATARRERHEAAPHFLDSPLTDWQPEAVLELVELERFLKNPLRHFFANRLRVATSETEDDLAGALPTKISGLERWALGSSLLEARLSGVSQQQWELATLPGGILPPGELGAVQLAEIHVEVEELLAIAQDLGIVGRAAETVEIDVPLPDGTRLVGSIASHLPEPRPGPVTVSYSRLKAADHACAWMRLMALCAARPDANWQSAAIGRAGNQGARVLRLALSEDSFAAPREAALAGLQTLVSLRRIALREPLPLFPEVSHDLAAGDRNAATGHWRDGHGIQEGNSVEARLAFGEISFDELLSLPAQPGDPGSGESRAERLARVLWGQIRSTCADVP